MAGYTPVFGSIYTGTLYGRWPAAAVWATLLPLFDRHGELDMSIEALCGMTGWPRDLLEKGISQLMEADSRSRTEGNDGRRLVPIDPNRGWGWKAVNHSKYAEKARKMARQAEETASGRDAARKAAARNNPGGVQSCPAVSGGVPLSDSRLQTPDSNSGEEPAALESPPPKTANGTGREGKRPKLVPVPDDFGLDETLERYVVSKLPDADPAGLMENFIGQAKARRWTYADWRQAFQTFVRNAAPASGHWAAGQYPRRNATGEARSSAGPRLLT